MTATDDTTSRPIIDRRGIDLILLCARITVGKNKAEFHRRLLRGDLPSWIRMVKLPTEASDWRLYEVIR